MNPRNIFEQDLSRSTTREAQKGGVRHEAAIVPTDFLGRRARKSQQVVLSGLFLALISEAWFSRPSHVQWRNDILIVIGREEEGTQQGPYTEEEREAESVLERHCRREKEIEKR